MRRARKVVLGVAAVGVPLLAMASPASAAQASDDASGTGGYTDVNGHRVNCSLEAHHDVDTDTGQLAISFTTGGAVCRGRITVAVSYVNRNGGAARAESTAQQTSDVALVLFDVGSTEATVDYAVSFTGCTFQCQTATVQTSTK
jgi:hypothetical protein